MTLKELGKINEAAVLKAYENVKDSENFQAMGKMQKIYCIAAESSVTHVTVTKVLNSHNIEL